MKVKKVNYLEDELDIFKQRLTSEDLREWKAVPRPEPIVEVEEERPKSPWDFSKSLFTQYAQDTPEMLLNCFDFDWHCSKIERLLKNATKDIREKIYTFLLKNYKIM